MYQLKKLVCLVLAVSIALSCLSVSAFAEDAVLLTAPAADGGESVSDSNSAEGADDTLTDGETATVPSEGETSENFESMTDEQALAAMKKVKTKGNIELYLGEGDKHLNIGVKNTKTGEIWFSNPPCATEDPYVTGSMKLQQQAQVWVTYVDAKLNTANANSQVGSVNRGTYEVTEIEDGIKIVYDFSREKEGFKIPVAYTITDDSFKAEIIVSEIEEYSTQKIMNISLVPHFGTGSISDEGYILVPDGSGAILEFNNGEGHRTEYSRPVYGRDYSVVQSVNYTVMQPITLPVYGIVRNNAGYVAVIDGTDADLSAKTSSPGASAYNYAYATFEMRKKDTYTMGEGKWDAKMLTIVATMTFSSSNYSVEFFFLPEDDVSYAGMARRYRKYLEEEYGFSKKTFDEDLPLFLEVYGAVTNKGNVLGVPTTETVPMTTYEELADILKEFNDLGIGNTVVDYVGWMKGGPNTTVPTKLSYENKLGGKSGYKKLVETAETLGAEIFPRVEFINVSKAGNGYSQSKLYAKSVQRTPIQVFKYSLASGSKLVNSTSSFMVSTGVFDDVFNRFSKTYAKLGLKNLSLDSVVNSLYSDFRAKVYYDINYQADKIAENMEKLKDSGVSILMNRPNAYAMVYADYLSDIPSFSSRFLITDYAVPFIQIVLHGWVSYSSPAISSSDDIEEAFLKAVETGSNLMFTVTAKDTGDIRDSDYNFLYASDYNVWRDTAVKMYGEINGILGGLQEVEIANHRRVQDDVFETLYADGTSILVNYSKKAVTVDGRTVESMSYNVKKGGI